MNEPKEIHQQVDGYNVTLTFKGYNPDIKSKILDLLCDNFEQRVLNGKGENDNDVSLENKTDDKE